MLQFLGLVFLILGVTSLGTALGAGRKATTRTPVPPRPRSLLAAAVPAALLSFCADSLAAAAPPKDFYIYKRLIWTSAYAIWGPEVDPGRFAAQLQAESYFRAGAVSPVGAAGLAQVMPSTRDWLAQRFPDLRSDLADPRLSPAWSIRALVRYDRFLYVRIPNWASEDERFGATFHSYNGGPGWLDLERAAAADRTRWFGSVELACRRRVEACAETRGYVHRIFKFWREIYRREP